MNGPECNAQGLHLQNRDCSRRFPGRPGTPLCGGIGEFHQGKGTMAAWRQQEILTTRGGEEPFQAVVVRAHRAVRAAAPAWK